MRALILKRLMLASTLLSAPGLAIARTIEYSRDIWDHEAKEALLAKGFAVIDAYGVDGRHFVELGKNEKRDPLPIINAIKTRAQRKAESDATKKAQLEELAELEGKLDSGSATEADLRRILKLILRLQGLSRI